MNRLMSKTSTAILALTASVALALPAAAEHRHSSRHHASHHHASVHHGASHHAYNSGYDRGYRAGRYAGGYGRPAPLAQPGYYDDDDDGVVTGRSAYVDPYGPGVYDGPLDNGGVLGTGVLAGDGVLGTGVLSGRGAFGIGVLGF